MDYSTRSTSARVREWQYLTGRDFAEMDRARTVALVSCSPLEVHGPHLPVITDNWEAEGLALRAIEKLSARFDDLEFVHLPPIYVAADVVPQPGSVMFRPTTILRVLEDLGRSLAKQGFRHIWVSSFHGGPRHFVPIELAAHRTNERYGTKMVSVFSLMIARLTNGGSDLKNVLGQLEGLTPEALEGDTHGGAVETSMMLHLLQKAVDAGYRALPRKTVDAWVEAQGEPPLSMSSLKELMRGFKHKLKFFERESYTGQPGIATPELGEQMLERLADEASEALADLWTGDLDPADCHSPLWKYRWLFTTPALGQLFERAIGYRSQVF